MRKQILFHVAPKRADGGSAIVSAGGMFEVVVIAINSGTLVESGFLNVASGGVLPLSGVTSVFRSYCVINLRCTIS
jgi:hypothetical protein